MNKLSVQTLEQIVEWYANGVRICGRFNEGQWCPYDNAVFHDALLRWNHYQGVLNGRRSA